jgi:hypothetical protein
MRFWLIVLFCWTAVSIVTAPLVGRFLRRAQPPSSLHWLIDGHGTRKDRESLHTSPITAPSRTFLPPSLTRTLGRPAVAYLLGRN